MHYWVYFRTLSGICLHVKSNNLVYCWVSCHWDVDSFSLIAVHTKLFCSEQRRGINLEKSPALLALHCRLLFENFGAEKANKRTLSLPTSTSLFLNEPPGFFYYHSINQTVFSLKFPKISHNFRNPLHSIVCLRYSATYLFTFFSCLFTLFSCLFTSFSCLFTLFSYVFTLFSCLFTLFSCLFTLFSCLFTLFSCLFT